MRSPHFHRLRFESLEPRRLLASDVSDDAPVFSTPPSEVDNDFSGEVVAGPYVRRAEITGETSEQGGFESTAAFTTVLRSGPSDNRVDLVVLGDGYTAAQIDTVYDNHVDTMLNYLFNAGQDPYPRYANFFNAHRINTVSNESGADKPPQGVFVDTAFDSHYFCANIERLLCVNNTKVNAAKNAALTDTGFFAEMQFVSVNDTKYGGSGGAYAVFAGGNSSANEVALHEVAHSFDNLADEYGGGGSYTGPEPVEVNVTTDPTAAKWSRWIGYQQPVIGTIGAYAGGRYYDQGIYRPSNSSKMRSLGRPFDAVSREKIILDIYRWVDPLDDWLDNAQPIRGADPELWVDAIDTRVQTIEWSVDSVVVPGANDETFALRDFGFGSGSYVVSARVYDGTDWVRHRQDELEQTVAWNVDVTSVPTIRSLVVNQGQSSRSLLTSIEVEFDQPVDVQASSFVLTDLETAEPIALNVVSSTAATTTANLTFVTGPFVLPRETQLPSLVDGRYRLQVIAESVVDRSGTPMAGDAVFGDSIADGLFRWFGDRDGDGDTDGDDFGRFAAAAFTTEQDAGFDPWFDLEGDRDIDGQDFARLRQNLQRRV